MILIFFLKSSFSIPSKGSAAAESLLDCDVFFHAKKEKRPPHAFYRARAETRFASFAPN
jgi:hypothetical protein